ncbi:hypothetical protein KIMH_09690 [Bombiscardovia apis]|uniref:Radical SAM core domain-containing protein n=1 Tax=Bombiscardovia apis TaxID=2932182 RepID=A0ABM8BD76_9BIFI|nr:radical SAM protein [Bombiscardovia apis]BDR54858.1 hypothetical protein KIMH_09690 [Bombiscardovia apis]
MVVSTGGEHDNLRLYSNKFVYELAIATTDECPIRCAHCLMKSGPERKERLTSSEIIEYIDFVRSSNPLKVVVFTGGESTLLGDELLEAIAYCSETGLSTRIVTNAYWATDDSKSEEIINDLRDAGLSEINISTDDFHAVWVPLDNVKRAWNASKHKGFETVLIAVCRGPRSKVTADMLKEFLGEPGSLIFEESNGRSQLPDRSADGTVYGISNTKIARLGRGRRLKNQYFEDNQSGVGLFGGCNGIFRPITLMADGTGGVCCGINAEGNNVLSLGRVFKKTGGVDIPRPSSEQQALLNAIGVLGPAYLYQLATGTDNEFIRQKFHPVCELCEEVTTNNDLLQILYANLNQILADTAAMKIMKEAVR